MLFQTKMKKPYDNIKPKIIHIYFLDILLKRNHQKISFVWISQEIRNSPKTNKIFYEFSIRKDRLLKTYFLIEFKFFFRKLKRRFE